MSDDGSPPGSPAESRHASEMSSPVCSPTTVGAISGQPESGGRLMRSVTQMLLDQEAAKKSRKRWLPPIFQPGRRTTSTRRTYLESLGLQMTPAEMDMLTEELEVAEEVSEWMLFDLIFGFFVMVNAFFIALEDSFNYASESNQISGWFLAEVFFFLLFSLEFGLRIMGAKSWQRMYHDVWMSIDFFLLSITALDLFLLKWVLSGDSAGNLTVFRAFRIFRLARLVRVTKLLKNVHQLVMGLRISARTLFWAMSLVALTVFIFGVFMVELVGSDKEKYSIAVRDRWRDLSTAATSFLLLATYSNWQEVIEPLKSEYPLFLLPLFLFLLIVVVGIMNMIIGVMVYTALSMEEHAKNSGEATRNFEHRIGLAKLRKILLCGHCYDLVAVFEKRKLHSALYLF
ncbi:unnamed protein product [Amoebophrya sp. A25]|nr:unnamed protein product [Amoebophrya sp. A25]|eukprot:GSA25T00016068001.1